MLIPLLTLALQTSPPAADGPPIPFGDPNTGAWSWTEEWSPETLESFQELVGTGCVEVLGETSMHSMSFLGDEQEWIEQVHEHGELVQRLFGAKPTTFRNTELVISAPVARLVEELGFELLLGEGIEWLLQRRSPHHTDDCMFGGCVKRLFWMGSIPIERCHDDRRRVPGFL